MSNERTLSIIKPDAVKRNITGKINALIEDNGLSIVAQKMIKLTKEQAEQFYGVHRNAPFFADLVKTMSSYPVIVQVLEGEEAIKKYREIMGATNPKEAKPGTIRGLFASNIEENSVHGSDSTENAKTEINLLFKTSEIFTR